MNELEILNKLKIKTELDDLFDHDIDREQRVIYLQEDVEDFAIGRLKRALLKLKKDSDELSVTIHLSTFGGCVYSSFEAYDIIRSMPFEVTIVASGKCMSAGVLILLAGDKRTAYPNTQFLVHECFTVASGKSSDIKANAKHIEYLEKMWSKLMESRTKLSAKAWTNKAKTDCFFNAEEALEYGLIHEIL